MPDRTREAVFSWLGARYGTPGTLPALACADVFAGSGSNGLEALSRGAADCVFFERGQEALRALRANIETLGAQDTTTLVRQGDAWQRVTQQENPFDLIFLDPPYADARDTSAQGPVMRFLAELASNRVGEVLIMLHHPSATRYDPTLVGSLKILDRRNYGTNGITYFLI